MKRIGMILLLALPFISLFMYSFSENEEKEPIQINKNQQQVESKSTADSNVASGNTAFEMEDMLSFSSPPKEYNQNAGMNIRNFNTKNTTRIHSNDPIETAIITSQTVFPATHKENQPGVVILVPLESWQMGLASGSLVHHPFNGPILFYTENGLPNATLQEIRRLNPIGNRSGTQIMLVGTVDSNIVSELRDYQVVTINGNNLADIAAKVDETYSVASENGYSKGVIVVSSDEKAKLYSLPAINWTAHMDQPILFVSKDEIPKETIKALQKRADANMYVLGPDHIISNQVVKDLSQYGKVTRIAGANAITNSIKFAQYKNNETNFGWGLKQPGHGLSFVPSDLPELAIAAAPFSHLGKHAPLIWLDIGKITDDVYIFLASIKPSFSSEPTNGPFNHGYVIGDLQAISYTTQGILDEKLEIFPVSGDGHGH